MGNITEKYISCSEEETHNLGIQLARLMTGHNCEPEGDLGAGKLLWLRDCQRSWY